MKPYIRQLLGDETDPVIGQPTIREYLQSRILECLQQAGAFLCLSFHGGMSLRFLYDISRYSEDLDFALEDNPEGYDFENYLLTIKRTFAAENYNIEIRTKKDQTTVNNAFIRFRGLLFEFGLSPFEDQVVAIKIEVDTNPPPNAIVETTLLHRHVDLHLRHHDKASLLAGKLQAIFNRSYVKGRDWYDLWWYLQQSDWPLPNFTYLNSGLQQMNSPLPEITAENWKQLLIKLTLSLDWDVVMKDVEPFIINMNAHQDFNQGRLLELLR